MPNKTEKQLIGKLGEDIACKYLKSKGFTIINRNYLKKCGEIDIIAQNKGLIHFIEVKSVSREINKNIVSSETGYRPEDNLHTWKLERLRKTIQLYLAEKYVSSETEWFFDVITVYIDQEKRLSRVNMLKNVIL
ncbi:MAG: YraN family protein [Candidatus Pacebacteria bacterium]|nr:YraN family protein [Candidatus Paceibacterota bacterium]